MNGILGRKDKDPYKCTLYFCIQMYVFFFFSKYLRTPSKSTVGVLTFVGLQVTDHLPLWYYLGILPYNELLFFLIS